MLVSRTLLLISLLAGGLCSQALQSSPAQQPKTVNVRSRTSAPQPGAPEVKAVADPNRVPLGDQVTFTLSPAGVIKDPCYQVTLFFGDGSRQIARQAQVFYTYAASGNYTYSILVRPTGKCAAAPTPTPLVDVPNVRLVVSPDALEVNQNVTFVAELSRPVQGYSYRFVFGDGLDTGWQNETKATHAYRELGTYLPYVDIGLFVKGVFKQVGGSSRQTITVSASQAGNRNTNRNRNDNRTNNSGNQNKSTSFGNDNTRKHDDSKKVNANDNRDTRDNANESAIADATSQPSATVSISTPAQRNDPAKDSWPYLLALPLLAFAGYKAINYLLLPRPTFVPTPAPGNAKASGFGFDIQVDVDPEVDGAFKIDAEGGSLIKGTRKSDE